MKIKKVKNGAPEGWKRVRPREAPVLSGGWGLGVIATVEIEGVDHVCVGDVFLKTDTGGRVMDGVPANFPADRLWVAAESSGTNICLCVCMDASLRGRVVFDMQGDGDWGLVEVIP